MIQTECDIKVIWKSGMLCLREFQKYGERTDSRCQNLYVVVTYIIEAPQGSNQDWAPVLGIAHIHRKQYYLLQRTYNPKTYKRGGKGALSFPFIEGKLKEKENPFCGNVTFLKLR